MYPIHFYWDTRLGVPERSLYAFGDPHSHEICYTAAVSMQPRVPREIYGTLPVKDGPVREMHFCALCEWTPSPLALGLHTF